MGLSGAQHVCGNLGMQLSCRLAVPPISPSHSTQFLRRNLPQRTLFVTTNRTLHRVPRPHSVSTGVVIAFAPTGGRRLTQSSVARVGLQPTVSTVVEHVVLFKVKDVPSSEEVFENLRALKSLDEVREISASKVLQILGANYTHALHSRHPNRAALDAYSVHPSHLAVAKKLAEIVEDVMAVNWESEPVGSKINGGHGAARIALIKLSDGITEDERSQVYDSLIGLRETFPFIRQISAGFNFSPARAKGFNVGFLAMFKGVEDLKLLDGNSQLHRELRQSSVAPFLEEFVIVDLDSKYE